MSTPPDQSPPVNGTDAGKADTDAEINTHATTNGTAVNGDENEKGDSKAAVESDATVKANSNTNAINDPGTKANGVHEGTSESKDETQDDSSEHSPTDTTAPAPVPAPAHTDTPSVALSPAPPSAPKPTTPVVAQSPSQLLHPQPRAPLARPPGAGHRRANTLAPYVSRNSVAYQPPPASPSQGWSADRAARGSFGSSLASPHLSPVPSPGPSPSPGPVSEQLTATWKPRHAHSRTLSSSPTLGMPQGASVPGKPSPLGPGIGIGITVPDADTKQPRYGHRKSRPASLYAPNGLGFESGAPPSATEAMDAHTPASLGQYTPFTPVSDMDGDLGAPGSPQEEDKEEEKYAVLSI